MKECSGTHPSGANFSQKEVIRACLTMGQRNAGNEQHATMVMMDYVVRRCLRSGRVPLLETLEITFGEDLTRGHFVYASCDAEVLDGDWACVARSIEANRVQERLTERLNKLAENRRSLLN